MPCRAAAYLARGWQGDAWFALLDSEQAMLLEPSFPKAHVRRVKSLKALGQLEVHGLTSSLQSPVVLNLHQHSQRGSPGSFACDDEV